MGDFQNLLTKKMKKLEKLQILRGIPGHSIEQELALLKEIEKATRHE